MACEAAKFKEERTKMRANKIFKGAVACAVSVAMVATISFPAFSHADETTQQDALTGDNTRDVSALVDEVSDDLNAAATDDATVEDASQDEAADEAVADKPAASTEDTSADADGADVDTEVKSDSKESAGETSQAKAASLALDEEESLDTQDDASEVTDPVAKIGSTGYEKISEAVKAAAAGDTIVLQKDYTDSSSDKLSFSQEDNVTLDLGGHTLTSSQALKVYKTLTIKNGTLALTYSGSSYNVTVYSNGVLNLENDLTLTSTNAAGTFYVLGALNTSAAITSSAHANSGGCVISISGGDCTVSGGSISTSFATSIVALFNDSELGDGSFTMTAGKLTNFAYSCLMTNGSTSGTSSANILGGEMTTSYGNAIYWPSEGTLTIGASHGSGPDISGASGIIICDGTLIMNDGYISATNTTYIDTLTFQYGGVPIIDWLAENSGSLGMGDALLVLSHRGAGFCDAPLNVIINAGTFNAISGNGLRYVDCNQSSTRVSGGGSTADVAQSVSVSVADGFFMPMIEGSAVDAGTVINDNPHFLSGGSYSTDPSANVAEGYEAKLDAASGMYVISARPAVAPEGSADTNGDVTANDATTEELAKTATNAAAEIQKTESIDAGAETIEIGGVEVDNSSELVAAVEAASVYDEVKVELELTAEPAETPDAVTGAKAENETATTFDIGVNMKVTVKSATTGEETTATTAVRSLPDEIEVELEAPAKLVKDKNVRIAHLHNSEIEYITDIEVTYSEDGETAYLTFATSKFSTFTVLVSEKATDDGTDGDGTDGGKKDDGDGDGTDGDKKDDGSDSGDKSDNKDNGNKAKTPTAGTDNSGENSKQQSTNSDKKGGMAKTGDATQVIEFACLGILIALCAAGAALVHRMRQF